MLEPISDPSESKLLKTGWIAIYSVYQVTTIRFPHADDTQIVYHSQRILGDRTGTQGQSVRRKSVSKVFSLFKHGRKGSLVLDRLRVVRHFSSGIVERAKRKRAWKSSRGVLPLLACGDFHARSRFARSTIPEEKWGTTRSLVRGPTGSPKMDSTTLKERLRGMLRSDWRETRFNWKGVLPIMAYTGRLHPKWVPFSALRCKRVGVY